MKPRTVDLARGKWAGILQYLGVEKKFLVNRNGPCPKCGGKDRFRWDNKHGNGSYICNQCGSGNGFDLLQLVHGWTFSESASRVDEIVGKVKPQAIRQPLDDDKRRSMLNGLWTGAKPIASGDLVDLYLMARGVEVPAYPATIRFHQSCPAPEGRTIPAMLAMVADKDNKPLTIHRTFLGVGTKADIAAPRALMPGTVDGEGACVRLSPVQEHIGIAEGIETALAASKLFNVPTWAAINATMMAKWSPPEGVQRVTIYGDNDPKYAGQKAAFALASKLAIAGYSVDVRIPDTTGTDWADMLVEQVGA